MELVSVVLPCLDEAGAIGACVGEALAAFAAAGMACEVIVADNGSTDGSAAEAEAAGARVVAVARRGYGAAVSAGIDESRGDVIVTADGDGTYPLSDAPALAARARESGAVVLGSRFAGKIEKGAMPFLHRAVGSPATRLLLTALFGVRCSDPHSGMRAMRRGVFGSVRPQSTAWEFTVEMLVNATRRGVPIEEVPIDYRIRTGASKLRALPEGWAFFRFLILRSPNYLFVAPGLAAMALGIAVVAWLAGADRSLGAVNLGINTLVVGVLLATAGYQLVALGVCARAYVAGEQGVTTHGPVVRRFSLERGIAAGAVLAAAGLALVAVIGARWVSSHYEVLSRGDHGLVLVGLTVALIGTQTVFASFFLALILSVSAAHRGASRGNRTLTRS